MKKIDNQALGRPTPEQFQGATKIPIVVVLENVRSALNVGAFFRTGDAFAVEKIVLCGFTPTPPSKDIRKSALGAEATVVWEHFGDAAIALEELKSQGYTLVAIEQVEGAHPLQNFAPSASEKYALVFGNEVEGVEQPTVDMCAQAIEIPQSGTKHSLNVSVAGGVVLWHFYSKFISSK